MTSAAEFLLALRPVPASTLLAESCSRNNAASSPGRERPCIHLRRWLTHSLVQQAPVALHFTLREMVGRSLAQLRLQSCQQQFLHQFRWRVAGKNVRGSRPHAHRLFAYMQLQHWPALFVDLSDGF